MGRFARRLDGRRARHARAAENHRGIVECRVMDAGDRPRGPLPPNRWQAPPARTDAIGAGRLCHDMRGKRPRGSTRCSPRRSSPARACPRAAGARPGADSTLPPHSLDDRTESCPGTRNVGGGPPEGGAPDVRDAWAAWLPMHRDPRADGSREITSSNIRRSRPSGTRATSTPAESESSAALRSAPPAKRSRSVAERSAGRHRVHAPPSPETPHRGQRPTFPLSGRR